MTMTASTDNLVALNPPADKAALRLVPKTSGIAPAEEVDGRDSYAVTAVADIIDRSLHATIARFTFGLSPAALAKAYFDWATHLAVSPGKRLQLVDKAARKSMRFANYAFRSAAEGGKIHRRQSARHIGRACRRDTLFEFPHGRSGGKDPGSGS